MHTWEYTWEILINILESFLFLIFIEDKMKKSHRFTKNISIICMIIYVLLNSSKTSLLNYYRVDSGINYICAFFSFLIFSLIFYNQKLSLKLLFSGAYLAILFASDIIVPTLFQCVFHVEPKTILAGGYLRAPATLIYISCIAVFVFLSHFIKWKYISLSPLETISYSVLCLIGFFFGQYIVAETIKSFTLFKDMSFSNELAIVSSLYCFLFLLLLTYIYILNYTKEQNRKLLAEKQQLLLEEADYKNLIETTESLRRLKHDMQHHLSAIQFLANNKSYDELNEYIKNYVGSFDEMNKFISTGNSAIDCILSTCIPKAEQKGIKVSYVLTVPDTFSLNPILTSSLLGNLWTNAITACENLIRTGSSIIPSIDFYIKPIENMILISIENTYDGICKKDSAGNFLSTKTGKLNGTGLKRINEIVDQNDGIIEITDHDNRFCVHIMFPLKEKTTNENSNS